MRCASAAVGARKSRINAKVSSGEFGFIGFAILIAQLAISPPPAAPRSGARSSRRALVQADARFWPADRWRMLLSGSVVLSVLAHGLLPPCAPAVAQQSKRIGAPRMHGVHHGHPTPNVAQAAAEVKSLLTSDRLVISRRLGEGAHGDVLLGELGSGGRVAVKVGLRVGTIAREAAVLSAMAGVPGFPVLLHHEAAGQRAPGGVLVMDLLGPSLEDVRQSVSAREHLPAQTVLRIGRGALRRLRQLHLEGFVHNDVKPGNILLGGDFSRRATQIHLIDFGLVTRAFSCASSVGSPVQHQGLIGSAMFGSLAAHQHRRAMRPIDDIEACAASHSRPELERRQPPEC